MGNLPLSTGIFGTNATTCEEEEEEEEVCRGKFRTRRISSGVTYYYSPLQTTQLPETLRPISSSSSSLLSHSPTHTPAASVDQPSPRPLLLFCAWLGARPGAVAKYRDLYLERGMDVLLVQSSVMHFLWPRWGLDYGLKVLNVLERLPFSDRPVLVHASSIGGFTFTQILTHIGQGRKEHAGVAQRMVGQIYDSLVIGTLEHMAIGLGKTLLPRFESLVRNAAMFYFWLFKSYTADVYENGVRVFHSNPVSTPTLFFFCENDAMCNPSAVERLMESWRRRGVAVESRKWKESIHAGHLRCHPEEYLSTLHHFLNSLHLAPIKAKI